MVKLGVQNVAFATLSINCLKTIFKMTLLVSDGEAAAVPSSESVSGLFLLSSGARTSASAACTR